MPSFGGLGLGFLRRPLSKCSAVRRRSLRCFRDVGRRLKADDRKFELGSVNLAWRGFLRFLRCLCTLYEDNMASIRSLSAASPNLSFSTPSSSL